MNHQPDPGNNQDDAARIIESDAALEQVEERAEWVLQMIRDEFADLAEGGIKEAMVLLQTEAAGHPLSSRLSATLREADSALLREDYQDAEKLMCILLAEIEDA